MLDEGEHGVDVLPVFLLKPAVGEISSERVEKLQGSPLIVNVGAEVAVSPGVRLTA